MGEKIDVAATADLEEGMMKLYLVRGKEILLVMVDGKYYAIDNRCAHMGGNLSRGTLEGYIVTCPRHGSQYDVRTGENKRWLKGSGFIAGVAKVVKPPRGVNSYNVETRGDRILIEV